MSRTWTSRDLRAPWKLVDIELTEPLSPVGIDDAYGAYLLLRHRGRPAGRLLVGQTVFGAEVTAARLATLVRDAAAPLASAYGIYDTLVAGHEVPSLPPLTVAVCTRNRAEQLRRTLQSLIDLRDRRKADSTPIDILVVDNAPPDGSTREVTLSFDEVRYVVEPVPGLDFGRNRALRATESQYIGFIDDDAIPDHGWLDGFAESVRDCADAAAFTGPVLPLTLKTEAQVRFEAAGGFGHGIDWTIYRAERWDDSLYPATAGRLGTGTNMIFRTDALCALGGFDEALDTGPPLPGGGDLDMFYRIVRSGAALAYAPRQAVHHDHRHDMLGLRRQFHSWGLSLGALMRKNARRDADMAGAHRRLLFWLMVQRYGRTFAGYPLGRAAITPGFVLSEMAGLAQGLFGEYDRSLRRIAQRRKEHAQ